jgi:hypothetical protein
VLLPLMLGMLSASVACGQAISRRGKYRSFPIVGTAVATGALFLLSTMDAGTSRLTSGAYMALLGVGLGLTVQVLVLATQNATPPRDLGVATSSINFFRSVGGSVGVALFGALFSARLVDALSGTFPESVLAALRDGAVSPDAVQQLPEAMRVDYVDAFAGALTSVFLLAVPLLLVAFGLTWLFREHPLRTSAGAHALAAEPVAA